jgi:hypothetical protein
MLKKSRKWEDQKQTLYVTKGLNCEELENEFKRKLVKLEMIQF